MSVEAVEVSIEGRGEIIIYRLERQKQLCLCNACNNVLHKQISFGKTCQTLQEYILARVLRGGCPCMHTLCIRRELQKELQQSHQHADKCCQTAHRSDFSEVGKKCSCYILTYCCLQSNRKKEKGQQNPRSPVATHHCRRSEGEVSK